jgi:hypothetical protein
MTACTHPRLREIAAYLDGVRHALSGVITGTDRGALVALPADGGWSAAQIVHHLGKVEGATSKALEGAFAAALTAGLGPDPEVGSMLGALDRFTVQDGALRRLEAPERLRPAPDADLDASWASLTSARERLYRAFATVDGRDLTKVVLPHPLFGPFHAYEWFLFIGKHEERHIGQLRRMLGKGAA